jgi:acyl-CoA thioester hydrolase
MSDPVTYDRKIRFSDSDMQGVVFNANYLTYWDDTLTDYMEVIGLPWADLVDNGDDMLLARTEIDYKQSGIVGETARTTVRVSRLGRSSITFSFQTTNLATGATLVEGSQIQVVVDHDTFTSKAIPDYFRDLILAHEGPLENAASQ